MSTSPGVLNALGFDEVLGRDWDRKVETMCCVRTRGPCGPGTMAPSGYTISDLDDIEQQERMTNLQ